MTLAEGFALADRYDTTTRRLEDRAIARLNRSLEGAYLNLEKELRKQYPDMVGNATLLQLQRKSLIFSELEGLLGLVNPDKSDYYFDIFSDLIADTTNIGFDFAEASAKAIGNLSLRPFADVNIEAVAAAANESYRRLLRHGETFADNATNIISMGLAQGWGINRITQPLQQQLGVTKFRAEAIARTESVHAYNDATQERYEAAEIEGVIWYAIGDKLTCPWCLGRHMQIYRRGYTRPPIHVNCRCTVAPFKREWVEQGLIDEAYLINEREKTLKQAQVKPRYDLAPFEKSAGYKTPPKPIYIPKARGKDSPTSVSGSATLNVPKPKTKAKTKAKTTKKKLPEINYKVDSGDFKQLTKLGEDFASRNTNIEKATAKLTKQIETATKANQDAIAAVRKALKETGDIPAKTRELLQKTETKLLTLQNKRDELDKKELDKIINAVKKKNASVVDGKTLANQLSISEEIPKKQAELMKEYYSEFFQITGGKGSRSFTQMIYDDPRAYAHRGGVINIGDGTKVVQFHEAGHHIEFESNKLRDAANNWMYSRGNGKAPQKLSKLTNINYDDSEVAIPGNFIDPYVGKIYPDKSTEVISMGIQHFTDGKELSKLYRQDKDHFNFILGILLQE